MQRDERAIVVPDRFAGSSCPDPSRELSRLATLLVAGVGALSGLYMRMCDLIRGSDLTDTQVREILGPHFPTSRISEILRVSRAPVDVYVRYSAGFFGFKAALRQCRGYTVAPDRMLALRRARRAAERLLIALENRPAVLVVRGHTIAVS